MVKAVEDLRWRPGQYALIVALAVISTKTWLLINGNFINNSFMYPDQLYMMHLGPFLGNEMYLAHLAGIGVAPLLIYIVCFQQQSATSVASSADHSTDSGSHSHEAHSQSCAAA